MTKVKIKLRKTALSFANKLDAIKIQRIKTAGDKKLLSDARLTDAMTRLPSFKQVEMDLIKMPRKEDLKRR